MMTIKEIADKYNISKEAVRKRVKKLSTDCYQVDTSGVYQINDKGIKILDEQLTTKHQQVGTNVGDTISALTAIIESQNNQIAELTKLLENEQKLHLVAEQKLLALEDKTSKKKWWHFFSKSSD